MSREYNNEYLRRAADAVDPDGATSSREYNNDYLKRIAEALESGGGGSGIDMTEATVGQVPQVASVDEDGKPTSWEPLSVLPTVTELDAPSTLTVQNMVEYHLTNVTTLAISYPQTPFDCWISLTTGSSVDVSLPASEYIGDPPVIGPYEKWELSIRNGVVVAGKAVADA